MFDERYFKVPKYYLIKKEIVKSIDNDEYKDNCIIPSERELCDEYNVSRITVRRAIEELVNEGYLYKMQGKGTYVKGDSVKQDLFSITSCTKDIVDLGMEPSRRVLSADILKVLPKRRRELELDVNDKFFDIDRVYYANDEAINRTIAYLPIKYFPGLDKHNYEKESLYEVLEKNYKVKITRATRTIEAVLAKGEIAELLEVKEGMPIILFRGITYGIVGNKEVPIESFKSSFAISSISVSFSISIIFLVSFILFSVFSSSVIFS
mgnify:CR=1 FL=1